MSIQHLEFIESRDSNLTDGTFCQENHGVYYFLTDKRELQPTLPTFIKQNGQWTAYEISEYTGGSSSYYTIHVKNPTTEGRPAYDAECNDIIEALDMNYAEGNAFKALWRRAAARKGMRKKGYDNGLYDAEKVEFFGKRLIEQSKESE